MRAASIILLMLALAVPAASQPLRAPVTAKQPKVTRIHGVTRTDDYFWLRDKMNPAVRKHLEAENAYTTAVMKPTESLQKTLYDEMVGRIKQTDQSAPYQDGRWVYSTRTIEGKQYFSLVRRAAAGGPETSILDVNALAAGHTFYALGASSVSDDGNFLAYTIDTTGYRQFELRVKDLRSGQLLHDRVPRVSSLEWTSDNHTLVVTTEDAVTKRSDKVWRHKIGTDSTHLLYTEKDELFDMFASRSRDRSMIFVGSYSKTSTEQRYLPATAPNAALKLILARQKNHEYDADADGGRFYFRTNRGAQNFRVVSAPIDKPDEAHWTPFIPHNPKVKIEGVGFFAQYAVVSEREDGLTYLRVMDKKSGASHRVSTPEPVYTLTLGTNREYATTALNISYNSLVTPPSTFSYNMATRERKLVKQQDVAGYDPTKFESRRVWVTARDGTRVPVAIVFRKGTLLNGSAPLLLYAYGSYGASIDPAFAANRLSLLDRGWIYALASIRGGGELGEPWREAGRMMHKMNTFTDFIDVAVFLQQNKYTSADRLMIQGGSAGGLLMGAVVNMRPDLFKAAVAQVPFVDVVNTMLDPTLPLTTSEYIEWGNPSEKPAYDYMMKYSPYDNVKRQAYPAMLVEVSYNDSQVPYWEGAKFAAKVRELKTDNHPVLVKANLGAGHGGASGRYDRWREIAFEFAFMISQAPAPNVVP